MTGPPKTPEPTIPNPRFFQLRYPHAHGRWESRLKLDLKLDLLATNADLRLDDPTGWLVPLPQPPNRRLIKQTSSLRRRLRNSTGHESRRTKQKTNTKWKFKQKKTWLTFMRVSFFKEPNQLSIFALQDLSPTTPFPFSKRKKS